MKTKTNLQNILKLFRSGLVDIISHQVEAVYLYGSQARGDASSGSDIDLLVVMREDFDYDTLLAQTLDLTADLSLQYDVVISRVFISKQRFDNEMSPFLMNVRKEAIPI